MPLKKQAPAVRDVTISPVALPSSLEAEGAVLGALLLPGGGIHQVVDLLAPQDFFVPANEAIYAAMLALGRPTEGSPQPVDPVTVSEMLENQGTFGHLKALGGTAYLFNLARTAGTGANVLAHAAIVLKYARARATMFLASRMYQGATEAEDFDLWLRDQHSALGNLAFATGTTEPTHFRGDLSNMLKDVEERYNTRGKRPLVSGVPTGIDGLDRLTGGWQNDFIIVAARPSMGKSAYMCHGIGAAAAALIPSLTFSLEMSRASVVTRIAAQRARLRTDDLKTGMLQTRDWISLSKVLAGLVEQPVYMDDSPQSISTLRDKARRWRRHFSQLQCPGCERFLAAHDLACPSCSSSRPDPQGWPRRKAIIFIDYLGRIPAPARQGGSDEKAVAEISRQIKDLSKELDCAVVLLCQLSRKCEERKDKRPVNSDLRDSGSLEQDADCILLLYRDVVYNSDTDEPEIVELILGKQRNGETGTVKARWVANCGPAFENLSKRMED